MPAFSQGPRPEQSAFDTSHAFMSQPLYNPALMPNWQLAAHESIGEDVEKNS